MRADLRQDGSSDADGGLAFLVWGMGKITAQDGGLLVGTGAFGTAIDESDLKTCVFLGWFYKIRFSL